MPAFLRVVLIYLFCVLCFTSTAQKTSTPKTLLWRISGKGLNKPSYLYGTMHLQDRRLFYFTDSLYNAIERSDGFATEVDFKEYMDTVFQSGLNAAEDEYLKNIDVKVDRSKLSKTGDSLLKRFGIKGNKLTKKDLKKIRDYRMQQYLKKGEMPTIMDGYLYGLATRQKKWTGGIEDVADQRNAFEDESSDLKPESVLGDEKLMQEGIEWMVRTYLEADLDAINLMSNSMERNYRNALLIRRNIKMASRMDSLSGLRSMFFAVGAAHLPGDSGVITLLRNRGFSVEPVFSKNTLFAETYAQRLPKQEWRTFTDADSIYTIAMPEKPVPFQLNGAIPVNMCLDITTMTVYFAGQTVGSFKSFKHIQEGFKSIGSSFENAQMIKAKDISANGMLGGEGYFENEQVYFRMQLLNRGNTIYMLMAGVMKKENLANPQVGQFFQSFKPIDRQVAVAGWQKLHLPEKFVSVSLPGKAKPNEFLNKKVADNPGWNMINYDVVDNVRGIYAMLQVRDIKPGYYLQSDSAYFSSFNEDFGKSMDNVRVISESNLGGYPVQYFESLYQKKIRYYVMHVIRGGRVYLVMVGGEGRAIKDIADSAFASLQFHEYPAIATRPQSAFGFYTNAAADFWKKSEPEQAANEDDATQKIEQEEFVFHEPVQNNSYTVVKQKLPGYYWNRNDSAYLENRISAYLSAGDSILQKNLQHNGIHKSIEAIIQSPNNHCVKRLRVFVNSDTLYTLVGYIPVQYADADYYRKFYESFRVVNETPAVIYQPRHDAMLAAMQSKDSAVFAEAKESFSQIEFTREDLSFLHKASMLSYADSAEYQSMQDLVISEIIELEDERTIDFISENYGKGTEEQKLRFLKTLASHHTARSYELLKRLWTGQPPVSDNYYQLRWPLQDSGQLTASLFPELLQLLADTVMGRDVAYITEHCLQDSVISLNMLLPYRQVINRSAQTALLHAKAANDEYWQHNSWIQLLARFNDKQANGLLQQLLLSKNMYIKQEAAVHLIKNSQSVNALELDKLARNKDTRYSFYSDLRNLGKEQLFPKMYATPQLLAESELYLLASDENEVKAITFVGTRMERYKGATSKFYLFKITIETDDGPAAFLGIAGPYLLQGKQPGTDALVTGIFWNEYYNAQKTASHLKAYLEE